MQNSITWKIGGEAGWGIMTTGAMLCKVAERCHLHVYDHLEYPSLIRGGHNTIDIRISTSEVTSQEKDIDLLVALNSQTIDLNKALMKKNSAVLYDPDKVKIDSNKLPATVTMLPIPLSQMIKDSGVSSLMLNNIVMGASCAILNFDLQTLSEVIAGEFSKKGEKVIADNQKAAKLGYDFVVANLKSKFEIKLTPQDSLQRIVVTGNEAIALGAIAANCKFYCAYPMTPTSAILHFMAAKAVEADLVVKHAEDEIAVINMAIGASFAGARAMVGTSGGGFSLMVEGLGLAGITETPLVIVVGQRPGPATGMPTWTGQADLQFLAHASQDEFPRIIFAPGDVEEAFYLTTEAFNLADIYQTPVFILVDMYLCESHKSTIPFDVSKISINRGKLIKDGNNLSAYNRYQNTPDGVSPRVIPGTPGTNYLANSYEHDETGLSTEDGTERIKQVEKRNRKTQTYLKTFTPPTLYGENDADVTLLAWGSTKGPLLQALRDINFTINNKKFNFLHFNHVWPLDEVVLTKSLQNAKKLVMIEGNSEGQMARLIRQESGLKMDKIFTKYSGRPFYPEEIIAYLQKLNL